MISVIIPSYNRSATIERSVMSVLNQTYKDIELIVVDDCSTDNTEEILKSIGDARLKYVCLPQNSGACVARNTGIEMAKGDYIAFQDSDDEWLPNKLEVQIKAIEESGADVCICNMRDWNYPKNHPIFVPNLHKSGFMTYKTLYTKSPVATQTILGKREVFEVHKFDPIVRKAQDVDWMLSAGQQFSFYYVDKVLVNRYLQGDSITQGGYKKSLEAHSYFLEKYSQLCAENTDFYFVRLKTVGRLKAIQGINAESEFKKIYELSGSKKEYFKYLLAKLNLLKFFYSLHDAVKGKMVASENKRLIKQNQAN